MPTHAVISEGAQIIIALIGVMGTIAIAGFGFLGVRANQTRKHASEAASDAFRARDQLENNHDTNIRDDLDEKFSKFGAILEAFGRDMGGVKDDIRALHRYNLTAMDAATADRARMSSHIDRALTEAVATTPKETP